MPHPCLSWCLWGEAHIIPILLRPCDWQKAPFGHLQALPTDAKPITTWHNPDAAFADVTASIRSTIEALLDGKSSTPPKSRDAIYLARIIKPPRWGQVTKTTLWLAAEGETTYFVDSISIRHKILAKHYGAGNVTGAVSPDADFNFSIEAGKTSTHALDEKALVLSHKDRQEVFCTIQLQPPEGGWNSNAPIGILDVILHYHTKPGGDQGRLYLRPPTSFGGDYLARLLKTDIEVEGAIITPKGLQRGNNDHDESQEPLLVYKSLTSSFNTFFLSLLKIQIWLQGSIPAPTLPSERIALNQAIERAKVLPEILHHLNALSDILDRWDGLSEDIYDRLNAVLELAIDLCTGILLPECTEALVRLGLASFQIGFPQDTTLYEESSLTFFWSLADRVVYALSVRHLLKPSDTLADFILAFWEQHQEDETSSLFSMAQELFMALSLFRQGRWAEAVMKLGTFVFGNRPFPTVMATIYDREGRYADASIHQRYLASWWQLLGTEHPQTALGFGNLATAYMAQGKYSEAERLYERVLLIYEQLLGAEHPHTATILSNLALLYGDQRRYAEAESLVKRVLSIYEQQSGAAHPDTATSLSNLATCYRAQRKYAEAESLLKRALSIGEEAFGSDHPAVATFLNNLALLYQDQGKYAEAEQLLKRVLSSYEQQVGVAHPDRVKSLNNYVALLRAMGRDAEARKLEEES